MLAYEVLKFSSNGHCKRNRNGYRSPINHRRITDIIRAQLTIPNLVITLDKLERMRLDQYRISTLTLRNLLQLHLRSF